MLNPLLFYPWRGFDFLRTMTRWGALGLRYYRIRRRVEADPNRRTYIDHALLPSAAAEGEMDDFVQVFADQIPKTHGAPVRRPAEV